MKTFRFVYALITTKNLVPPLFLFLAAPVHTTNANAKQIRTETIQLDIQSEA